MKMRSRDEYGDAAGQIEVSAPSKGHVMIKRENDANNTFRPSDSPFTEYEKEQIAMRKNMERLKAERLTREAADPDHPPKPKKRRKS